LLEKRIDDFYTARISRRSNMRHIIKIYNRLALSKHSIRGVGIIFHSVQFFICRWTIASKAHYVHNVLWYKTFRNGWNL